eukprot:scaffold31667_cov107-Isochrysis_galbana.AAC.6
MRCAARERRGAFGRAHRRGPHQRTLGGTHLPAGLPAAGLLTGLHLVRPPHADLHVPASPSLTADAEGPAGLRHVYAGGPLCHGNRCPTALPEASAEGRRHHVKRAHRMALLPTPLRPWRPSKLPRWCRCGRFTAPAEPPRARCHEIVAKSPRGHAHAHLPY